MAKKIFNNEARRDPERLMEVQRDLLEAATIGERMISLASQLAEAGTSLRPGIVPGQDDALNAIKHQVSILRRSLETAFGRMGEDAVNITFLGNLAADRYAVIIEE